MVGRMFKSKLCIGEKKNGQRKYTGTYQPRERPYFTFTIGSLIPGMADSFIPIICRNEN